MGGWTNSVFPFRDTSLPDAARAWDLIGRLNISEKAALLTSKSFIVERLGGTQFDGAVQSMRGAECLHGTVNVWMNGSHPDASGNQYFPDGAVTSFPQAIGLAATWNSTLLRAVGDVSSTESVALRNAHRRRNDTGGLYNSYLACWAPVVNIARDVRWGRVPETYGEDPFLTQTLAAQLVHGLQGEHPRYLKVAAGVKHFTVCTLLPAPVHRRSLRDFRLTFALRLLRQTTGRRRAASPSTPPCRRRTCRRRGCGRGSIWCGTRVRIRSAA